MEGPSFTKPLGKGTWVGSVYVMENCPLCCGKATLKFTGYGDWECTGCGTTQMHSLNDFKHLLSKDDMLAGYAESMGEPEAPDGLIIVSKYRNPVNVKRVGTGFGQLDLMLGGLSESSLTVLTGKRGEGKSTFAGQLALNIVNNGGKVCFYSGELNASMFQSWIFSQAAGERFMEAMNDQFGNTRFVVGSYAEQRIRKWMSDQLVLYDNTKVKSSERYSIVDIFKKAREYYGCNVFFVDNLMTARYNTDHDKDFWRAQSNFVGELMDFAHQQAVHIVLVAHPKKGDSGDINDDVSGSADITNRATNILRVKKLNEMERASLGCDSIVTVSKNRELGSTGDIRFTYNKPSRRLEPVGGTFTRKFGWENLC
jgi:twinkle protein